MMLDIQDHQSNGGEIIWFAVATIIAFGIMIRYWPPRQGLEGQKHALTSGLLTFGAMLTITLGVAWLLQLKELLWLFLGLLAAGVIVIGNTLIAIIWSLIRKKTERSSGDI